MFDFDAGKLIVIGIVALIAIPSKDLPRVLRTLGQATGRMRRMAAEFQGQLMDALREAELTELKEEFEETNRKIMKSVKLDGAFDPLAEARKQIVSAVEEEPDSGEPRSGVSTPHPEEPRSGVSKDEATSVTSAASFETRPAVAPQDEVRSEGETRPAATPQDEVRSEGEIRAASDRAPIAPGNKASS
jgi:sec-independent protein translocase protein TatB